MICYDCGKAECVSTERATFQLGPFDKDGAIWLHGSASH